MRDFNKDGSKSCDLKSYQDTRDLLDKTFNLPVGINVEKNKATQYVQKQIAEMIYNLSQGKVFDGILVLCVGSARDDLLADNLGPLVGSRIEHGGSDIKGLSVYGTMTEPLNGKVIEQYMDSILKEHQNSFIIGVDCAFVTKKEKVNRIFVKKGILEPGSGMGKQLPAFGDMRITGGLVHKEEKDTIYDSIEKLGKVDKDIVYRAAEIVSTGICNALREVTEKGVIFIDNKK